MRRLIPVGKLGKFGHAHCGHCQKRLLPTQARVFKGDVNFPSDGGSWYCPDCLYMEEVAGVTPGKIDKPKRKRIRKQVERLFDA